MDDLAQLSQDWWAAHSAVTSTREKLAVAALLDDTQALTDAAHAYRLAVAKEARLDVELGKRAKAKYGTSVHIPVTGPEPAPDATKDD